MTSPTTNKEIALELGWYVYKDYFWFHPVHNPEALLEDDEAEGPLLLFSPPDFEHDWAHAGPLLEEMVKKLGWGEVSRRLWDELTTDPSLINDPLLCEAISRVWLAWKKEEGDDAPRAD